jgi:hypothetical protein
MSNNDFEGLDAIDRLKEYESSLNLEFELGLLNDEYSGAAVVFDDKNEFENEDSDQALEALEAGDLNRYLKARLFYCPSYHNMN